jgi:hypothetical protein
MCNQAVSLAAAEIEKAGIPTVVVQLLRDVAEKVRPPRALFVPFPHGYPLHKPHDPRLQTDVVLAALDLLEASCEQVPLLVDYELGS